MTDTLIFVDAETYYDDLFSLRRMTSLEYITDSRFKLHMLAVDETHGQQPAHIVHPDDMPTLIDAWHARQAAGERIGIGAHNVLFDGTILRHHYNFEADFYVDTRSMSKGLWHHESASLAALAERLWPNDPSLRKGHELASSLGVYTLPPDLFESLAGYCQQDTRLCALAYHTMLETYGFPPSELETIDIVARMTITPRLRLDAPLLERYITRLDTRRRQTVAKSGLHLFAYSYNLDTKGRPQFVKDFERELRKGTTTLEDKDHYLALKVLGSNTAFCAWLGALGISVPMKPSPTDPRKQTPALGQSDLDYQRMVARYPRHKNVWEARKVAKSNIDLTRAQRFLDIAERFHGRMPMPLTYSAAHTHRFGGAEGANPQNMPRNAPPDHPDGDLRPGALRRALLAPDDWSYVYVADSSNIEARMLAYVSDNLPLLNVFAEHGDPYIWMAQRIYNRPLTKKEHPMERAVGKATLLGCFGAETLVLTNNGVKPIIAVRLTDKVWDGIEWVHHEGLLPKGTQPVLTLSDISVTPNHKILCGAHWEEAQSLARDDVIHSQALATGAENLPSPDTFADGAAAFQASLYAAIARQTNTPSTQTTSWTSGPHDALYAPTPPHAENNTRPTPKPCPTTPIALDCSTGSAPQSPDATTPTIPAMSITDVAASTSSTNGATTEPASCATSEPSTGGTSLTSTWAVPTITEDMNPATSDLSLNPPTVATSESSATLKPESLTSKPVYDLLNCGPRNRFTIITDDGPLIVHNCGYGMGVDRFRDYLNTGPLGMAPIFFRDETMYQLIISTYRRENFPVCDLWQRANQWLYDMSQPGTDYTYKMLRIQHQRIVLPSGLSLQYPNLRYDGTSGWAYDSKEEGNATRIFGAALVENCMQALTAEFIKHHMQRIDRYFKQHGGAVALQVHDEIIAVGPEADADDHMAAMLQLMRDVPSWAPQLPVDAEGGYARNYSK